MFDVLGFDTTTKLDVGQGVVVYVLDSGFVKADHREFSHMKVEYLNRGPDDEDGFHATAMASLIVGKNFGIAPGATLVSVVEDSVRSFQKFQIRIIEPSFSILFDIKKRKRVNPNLKAVVNRSLRGNLTTITEMVLNELEAENVAVVNAAGNKENPFCDSIPSYSTVISVGASTMMDQKASFSNYGDCVDIWAPGENIWTANNISANSIIIQSGTSLSAPFVTGVLIRVLQKRNLSARDLRRLLLHGATLIDVDQNVMNKSPPRLLYGHLNELLAIADRLPPESPPKPERPLSPLFELLMIQCELPRYLFAYAQKILNWNVDSPSVLQFHEHRFKSRNLQEHISFFGFKLQYNSKELKEYLGILSRFCNK